MMSKGNRREPGSQVVAQNSLVIPLGGCSRCSELGGSICDSTRRNENEATSHAGCFDHLIVNQELIEEWKMHHACSLSKNVESQGAAENHRRPPNCSGRIRVNINVGGSAA